MKHVLGTKVRRTSPKLASMNSDELVSNLKIDVKLTINQY